MSRLAPLLSPTSRLPFPYPGILSGSLTTTAHPLPSRIWLSRGPPSSQSATSVSACLHVRRLGTNAATHICCRPSQPCFTFRLHHGCCSSRYSLSSLLLRRLVTAFPIHLAASLLCRHNTLYTHTHTHLRKPSNSIACSPRRPCLDQCPFCWPHSTSINIQTPETPQIALPSGPSLLISVVASAHLGTSGRQPHLIHPSPWVVCCDTYPCPLVAHPRQDIEVQPTGGSWACPPSRATSQSPPLCPQE